MHKVMQQAAHGTRHVLGSELRTARAAAQAKVPFSPGALIRLATRERAELTVRYSK